MNEPVRCVRFKLWDALEMALFGKTGNTWEATQSAKVDAVFDQAIAHGRREAVQELADLAAEMQRFAEAQKVRRLTHVPCVQVAEQVLAWADKIQNLTRVDGSQ